MNKASEAPSVDPLTWESLVVATYSADGDNAQMEAVVQGSNPKVPSDEWPVIVRLPGHRALRYVSALVTAATQARYEQMVWQQLAHVGVDDLAIAQAIVDLRDTRPEPDDGGTAPLRFRPMFGGEDARPERGAVVVSYKGVPFCQWFPEDAMHHAMGVLEAAASAPLDSQYFRYLRDKIGLDEVRASGVVHYLARDAGNCTESMRAREAGQGKESSGSTESGDEGAS